MKANTIATLSGKNATTIDEVRQRLLVGFNALCNGTVEPKEIAEINNTAGKIFSSLKVQLEYHEMRGEKPDIEFLNCAPTTNVIEHKK